MTQASSGLVPHGFAAPLDPHGRASLYGPPPWQFMGRVITVYLRADPQWIRAQVPAPLEPIDLPIVRVSVYENSCDYGLGEAFIARHPEESTFHEGSVALYARHEGVAGHYSPFIWCDNDAEIAVGREMYGWPQRLAQFAITRPPHRRSWRAGDVAVGRVSRYGRQLYDLEMTVERAGDVDVGVPGFQHFFTMTVLPGPEAGAGVSRTLVCTAMQDVRIDDVWSGRARAHFHAPELVALNDAQPIAARLHDVAWVKPYGRIVHRAIVPVAG